MTKEGAGEGLVFFKFVHRLSCFRAEWAMQQRYTDLKKFKNYQPKILENRNSSLMKKDYSNQGSLVWNKEG